MRNFSSEWYQKVEKLLLVKQMSEMNENQLWAVAGAFSNILFEFELRKVGFSSINYQKYYLKLKKAEAIKGAKSAFAKLVVENLF